MLCKCGKKVTGKRVTLQIRDKKYQVFGYTCNECEIEFFIPKVHIFTKKNK